MLSELVLASCAAVAMRDKRKKTKIPGKCGPVSSSPGQATAVAGVKVMEVQSEMQQVSAICENEYKSFPTSN